LNVTRFVLLDRRTPFSTGLGAMRFVRVSSDGDPVAGPSSWNLLETKRLCGGEGRDTRIVSYKTPENAFDFSGSGVFFLVCVLFVGQALPTA
jgi:hypothetical protein